MKEYVSTSVSGNVDEFDFKKMIFENQINNYGKNGWRVKSSNLVVLPQTGLQKAVVVFYALLERDTSQ